MSIGHRQVLLVCAPIYRYITTLRFTDNDVNEAGAFHCLELFAVFLGLPSDSEVLRIGSGNPVAFHRD